MATLRIIGDVHAQIEPDDVIAQRARPYLEIITGCDYSVQVGDMGDAEAYAQLVAHVDVRRHRFFPGNHDHYNCLPPHSLGDFGALSWGGVDFFFVRGAASTDRDKLLRIGRELGKTLWFDQEELTDEQMSVAEEQYLRTRPTFVLSHDAPTEIARFAWQHARRFRTPDSEEIFRPSRTNDFLARLLELHSPRLWVFGHHHHNWNYHLGETRFVCVGELTHIDVNSEGNVCGL